MNPALISVELTERILAESPAEWLCQELHAVAGLLTDPYSSASL